ncbi:hypothetical protein [Sphingomonas sp.]|uniref:hypothetical protein n=1 Tax=Sphingomonas sp. TaxID=28214 RepID=UPI002DD68DCE|nr:hypothetical protein [Sphingomonas sp.]
MIRAVFALLLFLAVASCPRGEAGPVGLAAPDLETAAIARGLVRDPADRDLVGLYARDTDRLCVVERGGGYRIGAVVDYGEGIGCAGTGSVRRSGSGLQIDLGGGCTLDASFDGDHVRFPATPPAPCARLCNGRATFASLDVERLSLSAAEAATMRDPRGRLPCAAD